MTCGLSPVEIDLFFFQAEDGIRDGTVTGVQTCALPIWTIVLLTVRPSDRPTVALRHELAHLALRWHVVRHLPLWFEEIGRASCRKECRSRWSPYHKKKNKEKTRTVTREERHTIPALHTE